ncbi:hypothetical protein KC19_8G047400 [Ceratodon purpureus]|uniref:Uncharacterized protein n=1 Tax=Ceratodon purpureus TaxID=3225 RepID=A0A8T0GYJ3_CERPU|nr:hypothetical protein KC19_8G047400 [Ceratodon purpureus]
MDVGDDFAMQDSNASTVKKDDNKKPPFFLIKLAVDYEDDFVFAPFLEEIQEVVLVMLDDICDNVAGIEDLVSRLDPKIVGDFKVHDIFTISKEDARVEAARSVIKLETKC